MKHYVYVALDVDGGRLKVGQSRRLEQRLAQVGGGVDGELRLLAKWRIERQWETWSRSGAARHVEADLHARLFPWLIEGEWFRATPESLALIEVWRKRLPRTPKTALRYAPRHFRRRWLEEFYAVLAETGSAAAALRAANAPAQARWRRLRLLALVNAQRAQNRKLRADLEGRRFLEAA